MRNRGPAQIPKRIDSIKFSLMNPNEIRKMSSVEVKTADTYKDDGHAYKQGLMDPKMGVIDPGVRCDTCGNKYEDCPSHFGHISLELPVIHIGFTQLIKLALKATCNSCSKVIVKINSIISIMFNIHDGFYRCCCSSNSCNSSSIYICCRS